MATSRWRNLAELGLLGAALALGLGWATGVQLGLAVGVVLAMLGGLALSQALIAPPPSGTIPFPGPTRSRGVWVDPPAHILDERLWPHPVVQEERVPLRAAA